MAGDDATNGDAASRTSTTVVAGFPRREDAEAAVRALLDAGFREPQLGAVTGDLFGTLIGLGATEEETSYFEDRVKGGDVLITVDAPGRMAEAREILGEYDGDLGPTHRRYADTLRTATTDADDDLDYVEVMLIEEDILCASDWDGNDRRVRADPDYTGPERRLAGV